MEKPKEEVTYTCTACGYVLNEKEMDEVDQGAGCPKCDVDIWGKR